MASLFLYWEQHYCSFSICNECNYVCIMPTWMEKSLKILSLKHRYLWVRSFLRHLDRTHRHCATQRRSKCFTQKWKKKKNMPISVLMDGARKQSLTRTFNPSKQKKSAWNNIFLENTWKDKKKYQKQRLKMTIGPSKTVAKLRDLNQTRAS